jgi:hypothetical protein
LDCVERPFLRPIHMLRSEIMGTFEGQHLMYIYAYQKSQFSLFVILHWV